MALDRATGRREDQEWLHAAWRAPETRVVVVTEHGIATVVGEGGRSLARLPVPPDIELADACLLGIEGGAALFGVEMTNGLAGSDVQPLLMALPQLAGEEAEVAAFAAALTNWHRSSRFCPRCGASTWPTSAGTTRTCSKCATVHYPRTDPVVQILVHDGERCVVGRSPQWPANFFSVFAGFVEPGETPQQSAVREVAEETGLVVDVQTTGDMQAWPMPYQLLIGFVGRCPDVGVARAADDLAEVRVLSREQLRQHMTDRTMMVPPRRALAGALLRRWLAER
jgi:NAD+ diphosphatase